MDLTLKKVTLDSYHTEFDSFVPHVYNTTAFNVLNRGKVKDIQSLVFTNQAGKPLLGIILGVTGNGLLSCPYSAPFGGFSFIGDLPLWAYVQAAELLVRYARNEGKALKITLPPPFYAPDSVAKQSVAFNLAGLKAVPDVNYHLPLDAWCNIANDSTPTVFHETSAKKLRRMQKRTDVVTDVFTTAEQAEFLEAYEVIAANRHANGFPLRMSMEQIRETASLVSTFFVLVRTGNVAVAAAMLNHSAPGIIQTVYWADLPFARELNPMPFLVDAMAREALLRGAHTIDVGPSAQEGIPALGQARFKESVGCRASVKLTFRLE